VGSDISIQHQRRGRRPATNREIPDEKLLNKIKEMVRDGKTPKKIKCELPEISLYAIKRYYRKIRRGIW